MLLLLIGECTPIIFAAPTERLRHSVYFLNLIKSEDLTSWSWNCHSTVQEQSLTACKIHTGIESCQRGSSPNALNLESGIPGHGQRAEEVGVQEICGKAEDVGGQVCGAQTLYC